LHFRGPPEQPGSRPALPPAPDDTAGVKDRAERLQRIQQDLESTLFGITHEGSARIIAEHERRVAEIEALRARDGSNAEAVDQLIAQSAGRASARGRSRLQHRDRKRTAARSRVQRRARGPAIAGTARATTQAIAHREQRTSDRRAAREHPAAPARRGGASKEELAAYWSKVWKRALAHLGRRPLKLVRQVRGTTFYHKEKLPPVPEAVHRLTIEKREGSEGTRLWVDDLAGLLGLVEIGAVELHPWNARIDDIEHPDVLLFDLDPGEGVAWEFVIETALMLRRALKDVGLEPVAEADRGQGIATDGAA
jgi:hypothetical protein